MLFSCESYPKGKQLTLNPRQDHMKIIYHINCELFSYIYIFINCDNMCGKWIKCYFHILEIEWLKVLACINIPDLVVNVVKMKGESPRNRELFILV